MVDRVKPLKIESVASGGSQNDEDLTEVKPSEDYVAVKGVAFEDSDNTTIHGDSGVMKFKDTEETTDATLRDIKKSKVSQDDSTPNYLENKIVGGSGISITVVNPGANETLSIDGSSAVGSLVYYVFATTGNTADKWLGAYVPSTFSDVVPLVIPQAMEMKGVLFSNQDDDVDIDIEIYKNGTLTYTENVRNRRTYYNVGIPGGPTFAQGDRMSVFLKKFTGGTGDSTAQNPIVTIAVKITSEVAGTGGTQFGV